MRKSFDGLSALVKNHLKMNPLDGQAYLFINRKRTYIKCLYFEPGGYCLWAKRLEQGQFRQIVSTAGKLQLTQSEFYALLEGLDITIKRRLKRFQLKPK